MQIKSTTDGAGATVVGSESKVTKVAREVGAAIPTPDALIRSPGAQSVETQGLNQDETLTPPRAAPVVAEVGAEDDDDYADDF